LHRKNSLFYRTQNGAEVGDIYMSLIYTCQMCGANPFEYLQALQTHTHVDEVKKSAHEWLPWNYHQSLADTFLAVATRPGTAAPLGTPRSRSWRLTVGGAPRRQALCG
jgi:hypothetical protein